MTDVQKQLLIDYADGRRRCYISRDLRCSIGTVAKRIAEIMVEIDLVEDCLRKSHFGHETMAAYWKIKFKQRDASRKTRDARLIGMHDGILQRDRSEKRGVAARADRAGIDR